VTLATEEWFFEDFDFNHRQLDGSSLTFPWLPLRIFATVASSSLSPFAFRGCAGLQVHLGMKVNLAKIPVTSIKVTQSADPPRMKL